MAPGESVIENIAFGPDFDPLVLHRHAPGHYPVVLESVAAGTAQGRFDIVLANPDSEIRGTSPGNFLARLDAAFASAPQPRRPAGGPPFCGGWFLYLGYELRGETEPAGGRRDAGGPPVALALRCRSAVVRDRTTGGGWLAVEAGSDAASALARLRADVDAARTTPPAGGPLAETVTEPPGEAFLAAVLAARDLIARGDIYQANLSRRWRGRLRSGVGPADVYARLRHTNPAPFAGLAHWRDLALASSSPERLVQVEGDRVTTRPIAGTRPVAGGSASARRQELLASAKERAEHVMLIDLERNDLGRICTPGSVRVDDFMVVESYAHVHHIVSEVSGRLRPGIQPGQIIAAVFPGGTITGCPKVRCLQVIDALEAAPRGAYTGAMGYLDLGGNLDLNILIRTIEIDGQDLSFAAGSGIVADSDPARELEETRAKARGLLLALTSP